MAEAEHDTHVEPRIYEVGYHIVPTAKEDEVEKTVAGIRTAIEQGGGSFIAEGAPSLTKLTYSMEVRDAEKYIVYDRAHFGWIKFEAAPTVARALEVSLLQHKMIIRAVVFKTVREDTRAVIKAPQLREVKRTDTIKTTPRRITESEKAPVSETELDKALEELTVE